MRTLARATLLLLTYWTWTAGCLAIKRAAGGSIPVDLEQHRNNKAFGTRPGEADFDSLNQSYPLIPFAVDGIYTSTHTGIEYRIPELGNGVETDNVICDQQEIAVPGDQYLSASFLISADLRSATVTGNVTFTFEDGTNSTAEMRSRPWWTFLAINRGEITFPYHFTANDTNWNASHISEFTAALDPAKTLTTITLPETTNTTAGRLHVFALSLWQSNGIGVQDIRPTQKFDSNGNQLVEVTINNAGDSCLSGKGLSASISAPGIKTAVPGTLKRLCPGDQRRVEIAIQGSYEGTVEVKIDEGPTQQSSTFNDVSLGLLNYTAEATSLLKHEAPQWFDDAKYGIFIHWGVYAVPGWGNSTPYESYAEWYWWYTTHEAADRSGFYEHRLRTYGPELNYDDFFPNYTASQYNPKEWVDLFADAGAKYFVFTTKHHDGFSNFDTGSTSNRSSLHYGPKRDILRELFDAAETHHPDLHRGTYFSLPEWFNPDWAPYGFSQFARNTSTTHPGIIARNPYTGLEEPYTGRIPVDDFIQDLMLPQMEILAEDYRTDIMWCDAGAANATDRFAASWFNAAREQGRQVVINDRCGSPWAADHDTPEYTTFATGQRRKWESSRGMDPYSYGYNRATPDEEYMNATTIVHSLVDMTAKNGNFLLDIGPRADGTIVEVVKTNLREAGTWIHRHGEAVFNTTYWFVQSQVVDEGVDLRFTQTDDAFYILSLLEPEVGTFVVDAPVPILEGDRLVAILMDGEVELEWDVTDGVLEIDVPGEVVEGDRYCWVFKVEYRA